MTISDCEAASHAICPGNSWTFATRTVVRSAAAFPQTPRFSGMRTQAGPLERTEHQFAVPVDTETDPIDVA